jgi:alpha-N-arabinofuranosidase
MKATVRIDGRQVTSDVSPMIYGQFLEQIGRAIYTGVYDPGHPKSDADGLRQDVMAAIDELRVPILRWPGGNFVSAYHWQDGIGPKNTRPRRTELAWETVESNQFGTDEFIAMCRRLKCEPYLCVNLGWGTSEEAVNWMEYCNGRRDTVYADLRRANGHADPHDVRYWGLGNEVYGTWQHGHCEPREYAHRAAETAKMMRLLDPSAKYIFCGCDALGWNYEVLNYLYSKNYGQLIDYLSIHRYDGCPTYYGGLIATIGFEDSIRAARGLIDAFVRDRHPAKRPAIAIDEWNIWYRTMLGAGESRQKYCRHGEDILEELYSVRDALYVASILNLFIRYAADVRMANMAQLVNVIAPIYVTSKGCFTQPIYEPLKWYRRLHHEWALDVNVESDSITITRELNRQQREKYDAERPQWWIDNERFPTWSEDNIGKALPLIDAAATRSKDGRSMTISLVNRHESDAVAVTLQLWDTPTKSARCVQMLGSAPTACTIRPCGPNVEDIDIDENAFVVKQRELTSVSPMMTIDCPPHSVTMIALNA